MPLTVEVVEVLTAFQDLRDEWNTAAAAGADPNVFMTWDWLHTWWMHFGEPNPDARLHVVTLRDEAGLVAAAPLFRMHWGYGPLRAPVMHQISYNAGDYGGMLLVRRCDEAIELLLAHIADLLHQDARTVVLSRLTSDSTLLATLRARLVDAADRVAGTEAQLFDSCPYADIDDDTFDLAKRRKKHRIRQRLQRLADEHEVTFEYHTGPTLEEGLRRFVDVHRRRWDSIAEPMQGLLVDRPRQDFLLEATRALDRLGHLRLLTLNADGRTAAADLDYEFAGRVYMFKSAFDPDFAAYGPGQVVVSKVFEDGIDRGAHEFDFMRGDHAYKRAWTNRSRDLVTVTLTKPGWAGHLAGWRTRAARAVGGQRERGRQR